MRFGHERLELRDMLSAVPQPAHVVIVMEENHAYSEIIGQADAPYINSLAQQGALMTNSFAIEHPSQPNYLDLFSGSNQGINSDNLPIQFPGVTLPFTTANLGAELMQAGLSFTSYSESLPSAGYDSLDVSTQGNSGEYARRHNPAVNWTDPNNPAGNISSGGNVMPTSVNQPFSSFPTNFNQLPTVSLVVPNVADDMHDDPTPTGVTKADTWLQTNLGAYAQWAQQNNSLLIVTWDEDDSSAANQIPTIFDGEMVKPGQYNEQINHYTVLRTVEDMYGLPHASNSAAATPLTDIWTAALAATGLTATSTAGTAVNTTLATFTDADGNANTADYSAAINWGDGTTTAGVVGGAAVGFSVTGSHSYASAGTYTATVTINDTDGATGAATATVKVSAASSALPDVSIAETGPSTAFKEAAITYTITLTNSSTTNAATNVAFVDQLGTGQQYMAAYDTAGTELTFNGNTGQVTGNVASIGPSSSDTVTIVAFASGTRTNSASISIPSGNSGTPTTASATTTVTVGAAPSNIDNIDIDEPTGTYSPGDVLLWTPFFTYFSGDPAPGVVTVAFQLDPNEVLLSASDALGSTFRYVNGVVIGTVNLAGQTSYKLNILTSPTAAAATVGSLSDNFRVAVSNGNFDLSNDSASVKIKAPATAANVTVTKTGPSTAVVGAPATYTVTLANTGSAAVNNVVIGDPLGPNGAVFSASDTAGTTFSLVNGVTGTVASIAAGASDTITMVVAPTAVGTLANTAYTGIGNANSSSGGNLANNASTPAVNTTVKAAPAGASNLTVTKTGPASANVGDLITYTVKIANSGGPATNVQFNDTLTDLAVYSISDTAGTSFSLANGAISGTIPGIATGATDTITIVAIPIDFDASDLITLAVPGGNTGTVSMAPTNTTINPAPITAANVGINKAAPASVIRGAVLSETVTLTNSGTSPVTNVAFVDSFPGQNYFTATDTAGTAFTYNSSGGQLTGNIASIAAGGTDTITIVTVPTAAGTATDTAAIGIRGGNQNFPASASASTTVNAAVGPLRQDVTVTKTVPATASLGLPVTETITLTNATPGFVFVDFADTLGTNVSNVASSSGAYSSTTGQVSGTVGIGAGGTDTVTITFTPTKVGPLTDTATIAVPGGNTAAAPGLTSTQTTTVTAPAVGTTIAPQEGTAFSGAVATFTSPDNGPFTATINWGDGASSTTVSGSSITGGPSPATFTVNGSHTYADEGTYGLSVTITDKSHSATLTATGRANVAEADTLTVAVLGGATASEGTVFGGVFAIFNDAGYPTNNPADFTATLDWGDGTTYTTGAGLLSVTSNGSGGFTVSTIPGHGHAYAEEGTYSFVVTLADDAPGTASITATGTGRQTITDADALTAASSPVTVTATEGKSATGAVAIFNNAAYPNNSASDFTASINWGDNTSSVGAVSGGSGAALTVSGSHTYADEGVYTVTTSIADGAPGIATATATATANVADADTLTPVGNVSFTATQGTTFASTLATFTNTGYSTNRASDFTATIHWGDGASSTGTVSLAGGTLSVKGSHVYSTSGTETATIALTDDAPGAAQATATATITVATSTAVATITPVGPVAISAAEGTTFSSTALARFADTNTSAVAGDFTATINWGDGTSSTGGVTGSAGAFTVAGSHLYADELAAGKASVVLTQTTPSTASGTATGTANVVDADVLAPGASVTATAAAGITFSGAVATFTNTGYPSNPASDFTAAIKWGDGASSAGTVSLAGGTLSVKGSHVYSASGTETATVVLSENAPGTAMATATATIAVSTSTGVATITPVGPIAISATEGTTFSSTALARFTDTSASAVAGDFTATINWGDGTSSTGGVTGSAGAFTVAGSHLYADELAAGKASVVLTQTTPSTASGTATGTVNVVDADVLAPGASVTATAAAGITFSGTVATFSNTGYPTNTASDFTATIEWGDNTAGAGTVSLAGGTLTVKGSHVYVTPGTETATIILADDAPGSASAIATANVTVAATVTPSPTLTITKTGTATVVVGGIETYTVTISNKGGMAATGATVTDQVPAGLIDVAAGDAAGVVTIDGNTVTDKLGTLAANTGSETLTITALAAALPGGTTSATISNTASLAFNGTTTTSNAVATTISTIAPANLKISKIGTPATVVDGGTESYTITISNSGGTAATGATVTDALPSGLTLVSATDAAGSITISGNTVTDQLGALAANSGSETLTITATALIAFPLNSQIGTTTTVTNTASLAFNGTTTTSNAVTTTISTTTPANLSISKTGTPATVVVDGPETYTVAVVNSGGTAATGATVTDQVPAGWTNVHATDQAGTVSVSGNTVTDTLGALAANGGTETLIITATAAALPGGATSITVSNTANLTFNGTTIASNAVTTTINSSTTPPITTPPITTPPITTGLGFLAGTPGDGTPQTFIHNLYRELLGREPDSAGEAFWLANLAQHDNAAGRDALIEVFLNSQEYAIHYVSTVYDVFLGRVPDALGLQYWTQSMQNPGTPGQNSAGADEKYVLSAILASDEFYLDSGNTPQGWINALYKDLLGRVPDASGAAFWANQLAILGPGSRDGIVLALLATPEAAGNLLDSFYPAVGGTSNNPLPTPGAPAGSGSTDLAIVTGGGWENLYFEGPYDSAQQANDAFFASLAGGAAWDDVQLVLLETDQFYTNPNRPITH